MRLSLGVGGVVGFAWSREDEDGFLSLGAEATAHVGVSLSAGFYLGIKEGCARCVCKLVNASIEMRLHLASRV